MTDKIRAPWTIQQVDTLNRFQREAGMHPFTCGHEHPAHPNAILEATTNGWRCYVLDCEYTQDWAHAFMADPDAWPSFPFGERRGPTPEEMKAATEATELDQSRRYLRPVQATIVSDDPEGVHLAVYEWLPMFEAWATGPALCGESMKQGPLPVGTAVTCSRCEGWRPRYERMLAPGYRPEDDDPQVLRSRIGEALKLHRPASDWSWQGFGCQHDGAHNKRCRECGQCYPCPTVQALNGSESGR